MTCPKHNRYGDRLWTFCPECNGQVIDRRLEDRTKAMLFGGLKVVVREKGAAK